MIAMRRIRVEEKEYNAFNELIVVTMAVLKSSVGIKILTENDPFAHIGTPLQTEKELIVLILLEIEAVAMTVTPILVC